MIDQNPLNYKTRSYITKIQDSLYIADTLFGDGMNFAKVLCNKSVI